MNQTNRQVMNQCVPAVFAFIHVRSFAAKLLLVSLIGFGLLTESRSEASILNECSDAALRNAIDTTSVGGVVQVQCDGTVNLTQSLSLVRSVSLDATGHHFALSGGGIVRVISIKEGVVATLSNLTIQDGKTANSVIRQDGGGGIVNYGVLTLRGCVVTNNLSLPDQFWSPGLGGGILNIGSLTLLSTTVVNNSARGWPVGLNGFNMGDAHGGGVYSTGTLNLSNCIFRGNIAQGMPVAYRIAGFPVASGGVATGGALACTSGQIVDSTFFENRACAGDGGDGFDDPTFFFVFFGWVGLMPANIGGSASGGGIDILSPGSIAITNTTF